MEAAPSKDGDSVLTPPETLKVFAGEISADRQAFKIYDEAAKGWLAEHAVPIVTGHFRWVVEENQFTKAIEKAKLKAGGPDTVGPSFLEACPPFCEEVPLQVLRQDVR